MRVPRSPRIALACVLTLCSVHAGAGGGPLGIDHRLSFDDNGIWKRGNQKALIALMVGTELIGGIWEGGESRLGRTFWQSIDATALGVVSSETMKHVFTRARPSQTDDPDRWFQGGSNYSFPSGEVTATSVIVTPFILEYRHDYPAVYGLLLLPM
jgi:membrane-associated phospholipid phosphatase